MNTTELGSRPLPHDIQQFAETQFEWFLVPEDPTTGSVPDVRRGATIIDGSHQFIPMGSDMSRGTMYGFACEPLTDTAAGEHSSYTDSFYMHAGSLNVMRRYGVQDSAPLDEWRQPTNEDLQTLTRVCQAMRTYKQRFDALEQSMRPRPEVSSPMGALYSYLGDVALAATSFWGNATLDYARAQAQFWMPTTQHRK